MASKRSCELMPRHKQSLRTLISPQVYLALLIITLAAACSNKDGDNSAHSGVSLSIGAEIDRRDYLLAEPIYIQLRLINGGQSTVTVPYDRFGSTSRFFVTVSTAEGRPIPQLQTSRDSIGAKGVLLAPGEALRELVNLYEHFAITEAGEYNIVARFESDGIYFERRPIDGEFPVHEGWKGEVTLDIGSISIVNPSEPEDIAALDALRVPDSELPRQGGVVFPFFGIYSEANRNALLEAHPRSSYADYARYFEAVDNLERAQRSRIPALAQRAEQLLEDIRPVAGRSLFQEQVKMKTIEVAKTKGLSNEHLQKLREELDRRFPENGREKDLKRQAE